MIELEKRIENLKNMWFLTEPAYYIVLVSTKIEFTKKTNNISCGGGKIFLNVEFFDGVSDKEMEEFFKLECVRILLKHPYERVLPDRRLAYIASNMLIAEHMNFKHINIIKYNDVFRHTYGSSRDKCYEDIYNDLKRKLKDNNKDGDSDDEDGCEGKSTLDVIGGGHANDSLINSDEDCINNTSEWDNDEVQKNLVDNIIERMASGKEWGTMPNSLASLIQTAEAPKFDYKSVIRLFRKDIISSTNALTRMKPNRRHGFLEMGKKKAYMCNVLIVCDTSGSMSDEEIGRYLGFIGGFFNYGFNEVDVIQFDVKVYDETLQTFTRKPKFIKSVSRGGTVITDILDYVNKRSKKKYGGVVICTDGGFSYDDAKWESECGNTRYLFCINDKGIYEDFKKRMKGKIKTTYIECDVNN